MRRRGVGTLVLGLALVALAVTGLTGALPAPLAMITAVALLTVVFTVQVVRALRQASHRVDSILDEELRDDTPPRSPRRHFRRHGS
jgi:membrane protein implicated in regulation of membrane protease activity